MKILLTGARGQVGFELQRALAPLGSIHRLDHASCDLTDEEAVRAAVRAATPDLVVNAAAYTAVDRAEQDQATCHAVNAVAPGVLGQEAARLGARVIHYSTDYVFDGTLDRPYRPHDATGPVSTYGRTKLEGEHRLAASGAQHVILRTSWVFAARGANFLRTMLRLGRERPQLRVVDDQHGAPTPADLIADVTAHVARAHDLPDGVYHLTAAGSTSWWGYARFALDQARAGGMTLQVAQDAIEPIPSAAYPTPATRPANSRLDCTDLANALGLTMPAWQDGVVRIVAELVERA